MIATFQAHQGQCLSDLVLNTYGTLNMRGKFISDNKLTDLNRLAATGDSYIFDTEFIDDQSLFFFMRDKELIFRTGIESIINFIGCEDGSILQAENDKLFVR